jgi:hydrogenase maturation protease
MKRVLIAGAGNVFFGDDGFGVRAAERLAREAWPEGVVVRDFGIRGLHLAFELLERPDLLILLDATSRGEAPGTLFVVALDDRAAAPAAGAPSDGDPTWPGAEPHGMNVSAVLATVRVMGGTLPRVLLVGCEPATIAEGMVLSAPVTAAVEKTVELVREIVMRELQTAVGTAGKGTIHETV